MRTIIPINRLPYPLQVIEYGDFSCSLCREVQQVLSATLPPFGDGICHTFRHFPNVRNPSALLMALAAEAARRQDKYWAMHRALFAYTPPAPVSLDAVLGLAAALGLDLNAFRRDMNDASLKQRIQTDTDQGRQEGVVASPTLFLGTRRLHGRLTQARLVPLIRYYIERTSAPLYSPADCDNRLIRWSGVGYQ